MGGNEGKCGGGLGKMGGNGNHQQPCSTIKSARSPTHTWNVFSTVRHSPPRRPVRMVHTDLGMRTGRGWRHGVGGRGGGAPLQNGMRPEPGVPRRRRCVPALCGSEGTKDRKCVIPFPKDQSISLRDGRKDFPLEFPIVDQSALQSVEHASVCLDTTDRKPPFVDGKYFFVNGEVRPWAGKTSEVTSPIVDAATKKCVWVWGGWGIAAGGRGPQRGGAGRGVHRDGRTGAWACQTCH